MARSFRQFGNALYTGETSVPFIRKRKVWYLFSLALIVLSIFGPMLRGGFNIGIEFTGGSQYRIHTSDQATADPDLAFGAVAQVLPDAAPRVTNVGQGDVQVQTEQLEPAQADELRALLAETYGVDESEVTTSFIGAVWGQDVTKQAFIALVVFLIFVSLLMAVYFRTWKMSLAALIALFHDLIITAGIYGLSGFEVTPAAVIGFLTILGYSLYDTVVVFDKIRENTTPQGMATSTFADAVNLAVNQTLVRSINTSVVSALPVAAILFIGAFALGAGTLRDITLALFIGIIVGAYSTIFIAAPVYVQLREREPKIVKHDEQIRSEGRVPVPTDSGAEDAPRRDSATSGAQR